MGCKPPNLFIGVDVGTQGTKALVYDPTAGEVLVSRGSVGYTPVRDRPGQAEQDPAVWVEAVKDAIHDALDGIDPSQVKGLGVSGQQHGMVALDADYKRHRPGPLGACSPHPRLPGKSACPAPALPTQPASSPPAPCASHNRPYRPVPAVLLSHAVPPRATGTRRQAWVTAAAGLCSCLYPQIPTPSCLPPLLPLPRMQVIRPAKLWCDVESAAEAQELSQLFGTTIVPSITASKLLWMKRHEPEHFSRLAHVLLPHDYINWWLTGVLAMEPGDASGTGLLDPERRCWDQRRMEALHPGLASCFPPLLGPSQAVGRLRGEVAAELGLPPEVVVSAGGGDNMMSALGAGAVREGVWVLSLGTSGTLFGSSPKPVLDPSGVICPFCDATGNWLPLLCTINCTGVTEEIRISFGATHEEITAAAAREPPGSRGVTVLPYWGGERTPNWPHATGAILGLRPGSFSRGVLYRAALEGATFSLLAGMKRLKGFGLEASELRVVGGGSRNQLWRRVLADSFQIPLRFPLEPDSAALGGALQAAAVYEGASVRDYVERHPPHMEEQVAEPNHTVAQVYQEAFGRHQQWGEQLFAAGGCAV